MAKELPYFRFTVAEWLNDDISLEDYHTQGVFISVCAFYWFQDCSITRAKLEKRFSDALAEIEALLNLNIMKETDDGFICIKFLDKQFDLLSEKRKKRVEAGRKGGLSKSSNAKAMLKQSSSYKDKDKYKENDNKSVIALASDVPNSSDSETWQSAIRISNRLCESICEYDPTHRYNANRPNQSAWVKDIDKALRIDGRTEEQMGYIIDYIFRMNGKHSAFWAGNIESGKKLRSQFDKIKNQIKDEHKKTTGNRVASIRRRSDSEVSDSLW